MLHKRAELICYLFLCSQEELAQAVEKDSHIVANATFTTSLTINRGAHRGRVPKRRY